MDVQRLTYMANQIARAFEPLGGEAAIASTAEHITKFWDPRMKAAMLGGDRSALSANAAEAIRRVEAAQAAKAA